MCFLFTHRWPKNCFPFFPSNINENGNKIPQIWPWLILWWDVLPIKHQSSLFLQFWQIRYAKAECMHVFNNVAEQSTMCLHFIKNIGILLFSANCSTVGEKRMRNTGAGTKKILFLVRISLIVCNSRLSLRKPHESTTNIQEIGLIFENLIHTCAPILNEPTTMQQYAHLSLSLPLMSNRKWYSLFIPFLFRSVWAHWDRLSTEWKKRKC